MAYEKSDRKSGLTPRRERFCQYYVNLGGPKHGAEAARLAGFAPKDADVAADKLLNYEPVQRRIMEILRAKVGVDAPAVYKNLLQIATSGDGAPAVSAGKYLLGVNGIVATQQIAVDHKHEHTLSLPDPQQLGEYLRQLARAGIGVAITDEARFNGFLEMLGQQQSPKLIDLTPERVDVAPEPAPALLEDDEEDWTA